MHMYLDNLCLNICTKLHELHIYILFVQQYVYHLSFMMQPGAVSHQFV